MLQKTNIEIINSLSIAELDALRFIDNNKELVLTLSIYGLAEKAFVSTATIVRLAKKLGFSGFTELKYHIREELAEEKKVISESTYISIIDKHKSLFDETISRLDETTINQVVECMKKANRIHFFAKGLNTMIVEYASKLLLTVGIQNTVYTDTHIAYLSAEKMNENDLFFLCSLSGHTHQVLRAALIAKNKGAKIVSITSNLKNELYDIADYRLSAASNLDVVRPKDIASRFMFMLMFDILIAVFIQKYVEN